MGNQSQNGEGRQDDDDVYATHPSSSSELRVSHAEYVRLESPVTGILSRMLTVAVQQERRRRRRGPDVDSNGCGTVQRRMANVLNMQI